MNSSVIDKRTQEVGRNTIISTCRVKLNATSVGCGDAPSRR
jgi:hypothetical protein